MLIGEGGYYLGCTVSNLTVDVSLASLKDICNNNFDPYTINFKPCMLRMEQIKYINFQVI